MCQSTDKSGKPTKPGTSRIAVWFQDAPSWSYTLYALLKGTPAITDPGIGLITGYPSAQKRLALNGGDPM